MTQLHRRERSLELPPSRQRSPGAGRPPAPHLATQAQRWRAGLIGRPSPGTQPAARRLFAPLVLRHGVETLTFFSTVATFGTACDITVEELAIESFFSGDATTAALLRARWT